MPFEPGNNANPVGRPVGAVSKTTADARAAIALFVDANAERLQGWLDAIAEGVPETKVVDGAEVATGNMLVKPDPEKAFTLFQSVIEYHVPKLARQELTGKDGSQLFPTGLKVELVRNIDGQDTGSV